MEDTAVEIVGPAGHSKTGCICHNLSHGMLYYSMPDKLSGYSVALMFTINLLGTLAVSVMGSTWTQSADAGPGPGLSSGATIC